MLRTVLLLLAANRLAGVGLAFVSQVAILVLLGHVDPSEALGLPAAVVTAISGTVAVVFGPLDAALVALGGATVFGFVNGWRAGAFAALAVWPALVVAVGLFARTIDRRRRALARFVTEQEDERQRLALELHDETAQTLVAAQLALRQAERAGDPERSASAAAASRELIEQSVRAVRALAVGLRPKVLDDFGLAPAVERLASTISEQTGMEIEVAGDWGGRLPAELELALYRIAQDAFASGAARGAARLRIAFERPPGRVGVAVEIADGRGGAADGSAFDRLRERLDLLGGRLTVRGGADGATVLRALIPRGVARDDA